MKQFLIKYRFKEGSPEAWHEHIRRFIAALASEPALRGKISYRCMKDRDGAQYYHLAEVSDDEAVRALQAQDFFKRYTDETRRVAGGEVVVTPLDVIAETAHRF